MNNKIIVSKTYITKKELLSEVDIIGKVLNFEVKKENLYSDLHDTDFYINLGKDDTGFIGIWVIEEKRYYEDKNVINGENYYTALYITHDSDSLPYLNQFLKQFFEVYPEMLVCDEDYKNFYSLNQILNKENLPKWLDL